MRRFWRFYFLRVILVLVVVELIIFAWLQHRNNRPVANHDTASVSQRHDVRIDLVNNDTDKDEGDTLKISKVDKPGHGDIEQVGDRSIHYKPRDGFAGVDSFRYTITDGHKDSKFAYVKIDVKKNRAPVAVSDALTIFPWGNAKLPVMQNDRDDEGDTMFIAAFSQATRGNITREGQHLVYRPGGGPGYAADSFSYALSDGVTTSEMAKVVLHMKEVASSKFCNTPYYGDLRNYTQYNASRWDIDNEGGNLVVCINTSGYDGLSGNRPGACNLLKSRWFNGDFNINIKVKSTDDLEKNNAADYAIFFAYIDENNYCYASFSSHDEDDGFTGLYKIKDGLRETVAFKGKSFSDNHYHNTNIVRKGNTVTLKFDGKELCKASDGLFGKSGRIGFGSYNDMACFDDIDITGNYLIK